MRGIVYDPRNLNLRQERAGLPAELLCRGVGVGRVAEGVFRKPRSSFLSSWQVGGRYHLRRRDLQPDSFDIREMVCSASEAAAYHKLVGEQTLQKK
jgi:hypothetical protein